MKLRIWIWASAGFLVACCWIVYAFAAPPESFGASMRNPVLKAFIFTSCPISIAGSYFPLRFWWLPPINAATYALIGVIVETLRSKLYPRSVA